MNEASIDRVRSALNYLNPNDRTAWVRAGMAIKAEFGESGFHIWDEWAASGDTHTASSARHVWKSIKEGGKTTIATLFWDAKNAGWKDDKKYTKPTKEEIEKRRALQVRRIAEAEAEEAAQHEATAQKAQRLWNAAKPVDEHPYLTLKGVKSHGLRYGAYEYEVLDENTGEIFAKTSQALLIPIMDRQRKIWSLQAISARPGGPKMLLKNGRKSGNFFVVGEAPKKSEDGRPIFILAEGYATGASVHECTGHLVLVCIDAGNLTKVAAALRAAAPAAIIIIAADNDTETAGNPGVTMANKAARASGGLVAVPAPGDFNDLHLSAGADAVVEAIEAAEPPPPEQEEQQAPKEEPEPDTEPEHEPAGMPEPAPWEDAPGEPMQPPAEHDPEPAIPDDDPLSEIDCTAHFTVLGYDRGRYYFFSAEQCQVHDLPASALSVDATLIMLAPLQFWEANFPAKTGGIEKRAAMDWIFRLAKARGVYDKARVRGRGAWVDDGRIVYHHGSHLSVDGVKMPVTKIKSRYVYEVGKSVDMHGDEVATDEEGSKLLEVAKMFRWSKPGAAALLAGWTFLAPVCGALRWRPHIWLTGGAGSGKSTILNDFVRGGLGGEVVFAQGNSSESGIRQRLHGDALPVLFDESEQNDEGERRRMQSVLALIRQSSTESEAKTLKGTVSGDGMDFHIRSMFCLASVQAGMEHKADQDRLTKLSLLPPKDDPADRARWDEIKAALYLIQRDPAIRGRLLRRAISLLPIIHKNVTVFVAAAAKKFGTQRMGDQYGTLIAGTWTLCNSTVATPEQADAMIASYEWDEFTDSGDVDDPEKALRAILEAKVQIKGEPVSLGSLVAMAAGHYVEGLGDGITDKLAGRVIRENGLNIAGSYLLIQNSSSALRKLLSDTPFGSDYKSLLGRMAGARKFESRRFAPGVNGRCVGIPLASILGEEAPPI